MPTHGVSVDRLTGGIRTIDTVSGVAIGVMATASEYDEGDLVLIDSGTVMSTVDDGTGTIIPIVDMIRRYSTAPIVLVVITSAHLTSAAGSSSTYTMGFRFLQAEAELGVRPRILAAALVTGANSDLIAVAGRLYAEVFLDGPNTTDALAITGIGSITSQRCGYCDPAVVDDNDVTIGSSVVYAAIASTLNFWESVSNIELTGIKRLSRPISFVMGDSSSQAELLNVAKINTIVRKNGWRLWGGLSASSDTLFKFLNIARTDDVIAESILEAFLWAVDKGITKTFVEDVLESINAFLRDLKARGAITGGEAWVDKSLNSPTSVQAGNLYIDYKFTGVYPAHSIIARRHMTNEYLAQIFS